MAFANVAGELVGGLFTRDTVLLGMPVHLFAVGPACMRGGWLQLLANGLDDSAAMTCRQFRDARQTVLDSLDLGAIPAGYLVAAADLFATGPPLALAALGGAGTTWLRTITFASFAMPVRGHAGLFSLAPLADLYRFAPGIFLSASRDQAGAPLRLLLEEGQRRALAMEPTRVRESASAPPAMSRRADPVAA